MGQKLNKYKVALIVLLPLVVIGLGVWYGHAHNLAVFNPQGTIGTKERNLITVSLLLSLIVVIPVFTMLFVFALKYREGNTKAKYSPELDGNRAVETTWWAIPSILILLLGIIAWNSSHALDPFRPIASNIQPLTIQVVALDWKWLFIYPRQGIATVNYVQIPTNTPLEFDITSDSVMNSFWIPQLGGQIYAMPGMATQLHLMASKTGIYKGLSANISGEGFSSMKFNAEAISPGEFTSWASDVKKLPTRLQLEDYENLAKPSSDVQPIYYSVATPGLFNLIVEKYMTPLSQSLLTTQGVDSP